MFYLRFCIINKIKVVGNTLVSDQRSEGLHNHCLPFQDLHGSICWTDAWLAFCPGSVLVLQEPGGPSAQSEFLLLWISTAWGGQHQASEFLKHEASDWTQRAQPWFHQTREPVSRSEGPLGEASVCLTFWNCHLHTARGIAGFLDSQSSLRLVGRPALRRVLVFTKFLHLRTTEKHLRDVGSW